MTPQEYHAHCVAALSENLCPTCYGQFGLNGTGKTFCNACRAYWVMHGVVIWYSDMALDVEMIITPRVLIGSQENPTIFIMPKPEVKFYQYATPTQEQLQELFEAYRHMRIPKLE